MNIQLIQGDITRARVDAIVNAANSRLAGGGGVDGAIHQAAGPRLLEAGQAHVRAHGLLPPGRAVITPGFNLPARYVIHTVGPVWHGGKSNEPEVLASCYRESLELARKHNLQSLAFSAISCGVYGYPPEKAAPIGLTILEKYGPASGITTIQVYLFTPSMFTIWHNALEALSPGDSSTTP
jgi:O-acetyl-ADP-ribose deacetylase (regulator of RNase III)